jgi:hypothetical protein
MTWGSPAAALAGCGSGNDADKLSDVERTRWRKQACDWLWADLAEWAKKLGSASEADRVMVQKALMHWRGDPDLVGIRQPSALDKLSTDERKKILSLWSEVDSVLGRTRMNKSSLSPDAARCLTGRHCGTALSLYANLLWHRRLLFFIGSRRAGRGGVFACDPSLGEAHGCGRPRLADEAQDRR